MLHRSDGGGLVITATFRPEGTGVAGHTQPRIEIHWEDGDEVSWDPASRGYEKTDTLRAEEAVRWIFHEEIKELGGFYQYSTSFHEREKWWPGDDIEEGFLVVEFWMNRVDDARALSKKIAERLGAEFEERGQTV
jgi:hypothetical protein